MLRESSTNKKRIAGVIFAALLLWGCNDRDEASGDTVEASGDTVEASGDTVSGQGEDQAALIQSPVPDFGIIPAPVNIIVKEGAFTLSARTPIMIDTTSASAEKAARYFTEIMQNTAGIHLPVQSGEMPTDQPPIRFSLSEAGVNEREGAYQITVAPDGVDVRASNAAGLFYGAVSLWQMATPWTDGADSQVIQSVHITDAPHFQWRGLMLDSARHFQSPAYIKQFIDWMALHKLNVFHWHLTDDQGWRLEIKKYPRLTEIGAWRVEPGAAADNIDPETGKPYRYGGFYTQDEVRDIVKYAAERHITVLPEIEMPGHALAPIAAYPALASIDNPPDHVITDWGIFPYLYNVDEETFAFLEDVLDEVITLFPSPYIHIGGDEAVKRQWENSPSIQARMKELGVDDEKKLQSYFIGRIEKYINSKGRNIIGWDEILEGGLAPNATVMSWRGIEGAIEAASKGHDTVLSPAPVLYFDHIENQPGDRQPGRAGVVSMADIYAFDPYPEELSEEQHKHILGIQGNIWSEHIRGDDRVTYMTFPRAAAVAEIAWTPAERRNWQSFTERMPSLLARYRKLGLKYADLFFTVNINVTSMDKPDRVTVGMSNQAAFGDIYYTLDNSEPTVGAALFTGPLTLDMPVNIRAAAFSDSRPLAHISDVTFNEMSARRKSSFDLKLCTEKLHLALEDDDPAEGKRAVFLVDIMNPCWIYEAVDLSGISAIEFSVGQIPFNFQIGDAVDAITFRTPRTAAGEMEVRLDNCQDGALLGFASLEPAIAGKGVTRLEKINLPAGSKGVHDLCFSYTARDVEPIWTIDHVQLIPAAHK